MSHNSRISPVKPYELLRRLASAVSCSSALLPSQSAPASAQSHPKAETIEATAQGTDFQAGQLVTITFSIYEYSPLSDQQILNDAFQKGKDQGLYNALSKMRAVGHIAVNAT